MKKKIVLLHTNDIHGDFLPKEKDGKQTGGIAYLSGYIKDVRKNEKNVLFTISGDMFRGSIVDSEYKGISTIDLINMLYPDVVTIGNHEVDYGLGHLLFIEKCADFPLINSNLVISEKNKRLFTPYIIKEIDGVKIMFIGVITSEIVSSVKSKEIIGDLISVKDAAKEIGIICDNYRNDDVDYVVVLSHIGFEEDKKLAEALKPQWKVNLIIGGHSHTLLDKEVIVNNIPIVQVGIGTSHIGRFDFTFEDNTFVNYKWQCIEINKETAKFDEAMNYCLNVYKGFTDIVYEQVISIFERKLTHPNRYQETELGNLFADMLQKDSSFDMVLYGSGSIRTSELGPYVTYKNLMECVPYDDSPVWLINVTGAQLRTMMYSVFNDRLFAGEHLEFYQVSKGFHLKYSKSAHKFLEFTLNGEEITDDQIIKVGIQEYHYINFGHFNIDELEMMKNGIPRQVITSAFSVFTETVSTTNNIDSHIENRLEVVD